MTRCKQTGGEAAVSFSLSVLSPFSSRCLRLQQELMGIMMGADPGASAFPNDDNLFEWTATLSGSEDTAVS